MKNALLIAIGILVFSFSSLSQEMGEKVINYMNECSCNEILMISGGLEKKYTGLWLENMKLENQRPVGTCKISAASVLAEANGATSVGSSKDEGKGSE